MNVLEASCILSVEVEKALSGAGASAQEFFGVCGVDLGVPLRLFRLYPRDVAYCIIGDSMYGLVAYADDSSFLPPRSKGL